LATINVSLPSDGTNADVSDYNSPINTIVTEINGRLSNANIAPNAAIDRSKIAGVVSGWESLPVAPNTVTNNGNRSYDLVFNGTDLTDTVSEGMRLRTTRTVSAPTQCADLESSSSQYFSKTSPAGLSFTTTFTCSAWVKLESYGAAGGIIARRNANTEGWSFRIGASGQPELTGLRIASNNKAIQAYQSIPLNKWVHVAACLDMTVGDTSAQKIWIDGVEVPRAYVLNGTATAIIQGTVAMTVGAEQSTGTNPFDGKIAQASVHSACLSDAQIKALMTQTISSSSPSIVSGFTLNGVLTDVTANANDLTAVASATATNVDSPFGSYLGGTLDYGIITKTAFSTNTTLTVQFPEGSCPPTSGGVSAVAYSTQAVPYLFPRDSGRWEVESLSNDNTSSITGSWTNPGSFRITVPVGSWTISPAVTIRATRTTGSGVNVAGALSESTSAISDGYTQTVSTFETGASAQPFAVTGTAQTPVSKTFSSQSVVYFVATGTLTAGNLSTQNGKQHYIKAIPAYL